MDTGFDFDLVCIGSGPAGQRAAIQAAKLGKRAAVVEKGPTVGGVCLDKGTIPSKTFREPCALSHTNAEDSAVRRDSASRRNEDAALRRTNSFIVWEWSAAANLG